MLKTKPKIPKSSNEISGLKEKLFGRVHRAIAILLVAIGIYFLIALLSFHPHDPSWVNNYDFGYIYNLGGLAGAWFAYTLNFIFGYASFWIAITVFVSAYLFFQPYEDITLTIRLTRWFGHGLMLIALCGLLTIHFNGAGMPASAGGWVGEVSTRGFVNVFGLLGASLLLIALLLSSIQLLINVSWLRIMDYVGSSVLQSGHWIATLISRWREWKITKEKRAQRRILTTEGGERFRNRKKPTAKIEPSVSQANPSKRSLKEKQIVLFHDKSQGKIPSLNILDQPAVPAEQNLSNQSLDNMAKQLEIKLADFGIEAEVVKIQTGPVVTLFELSPAPGTKVSRITSLEKDLARALSVPAVRVIEIIPGKPVVGLEIPNEIRQTVYLSEILNTEIYDKAQSCLTLALGKDTTGKTVLISLQKLPHLLVAGTTGAGKSVAIHAMLMSLLFKASPQQLRLILIDPKMLELNVYNNIPHLLTPVITDVKLATHALRWAVGEMERRYKLMSCLGVRNLDSYNRMLSEAQHKQQPITDPIAQVADGEVPPVLETLPYIVIVIDEFADMIMTVGKKIEEVIARLAQKARAAGIHLLIATQRPSVDVITGLIKANIPSRIAFQVSSMVDSRTILDQKGAEQLLGQGDMLYLAPGAATPVRIHGAFVSDQEVKRVVEFLQQQEVDYIEVLQQENVDTGIPGVDDISFEDNEPDELYVHAVGIVTETQKVSISFLQRRLRIGYNRAARIVEQMEEAGIVSVVQSNGNREVIGTQKP